MVILASFYVYKTTYVGICPSGHQPYIHPLTSGTIKCNLRNFESVTACPYGCILSKQKMTHQNYILLKIRMPEHSYWLRLGILLLAGSFG